MHFSKYIALAAFIATGVLAAPAAEPEPNPPKPSKPSKPSKPAQPTQTAVVQQNSCGNGNMPFCCNTDNSGKYTSCYTMGMILSNVFRSLPELVGLGLATNHGDYHSADSTRA